MFRFPILDQEDKLQLRRYVSDGTERLSGSQAEEVQTVGLRESCRQRPRSRPAAVDLQVGETTALICCSKKTSQITGVLLWRTKHQHQQDPRVISMILFTKCYRVYVLDLSRNAPELKNRLHIVSPAGSTGASGLRSNSNPKGSTSMTQDSPVNSTGLFIVRLTSVQKETFLFLYIS